MPHACIGWLEDNRRTTGGTPGQRSTSSWFSSPCGHTGPPTVVGLPQNALQMRGGRGSVSDRVAVNAPGH